jgi:hypothetical protein
MVVVTGISTGGGDAGETRNPFAPQFPGRNRNRTSK